MPAVRPATSPAFGYDPVTRVIHWLAAVVILTNAALGVSMVRIEPVDEATAASIIRLFTIHKSLGLLSFAVALARIGWAVTGARRPGPLHPERRIETFAAATVHWSLYGAMLVMPLSGWLYHAASPPYAPIPWPFGQGLPGIERSPDFALVLRTVHRMSSRVLYGAVALHLAGAFKHAIVNMDATIARMTSGLGAEATRARTRLLPALAALVLWAATVFAAVQTAPEPEADPFSDIGADTLGEAPAP
ncbi:MAG: cytochrome b [Pseudomonadota bacterium]